MTSSTCLEAPAVAQRLSIFVKVPTLIQTNPSLSRAPTSTVYFDIFILSTLRLQMVAYKIFRQKFGSIASAAIHAVCSAHPILT
jgi:hypothetical protein